MGTSDRHASERGETVFRNIGHRSRSRRHQAARAVRSAADALAAPPALRRRADAPAQSLFDDGLLSKEEYESSGRSC